MVRRGCGCTGRAVGTGAPGARGGSARASLAPPGWRLFDPSLPCSSSAPPNTHTHTQPHQVSWCKLEVELSGPKALLAGKHAGAAEMRARRPPPPLTVAALTLRLHTDARTQQPEILAASVVRRGARGVAQGPAGKVEETMSRQAGRSQQAACGTAWGRLDPPVPVSRPPPPNPNPNIPPPQGAHDGRQARHPHAARGVEHPAAAAQLLPGPEAGGPPLAAG
jgi:hypothetical protein